MAMPRPVEGVGQSCDLRRTEHGRRSLDQHCYPAHCGGVLRTQHQLKTGLTDTASHPALDHYLRTRPKGLIKMRNEGARSGSVYNCRKCDHACARPFPVLLVKIPTSHPHPQRARLPLMRGAGGRSMCLRCYAACSLLACHRLA